MPADSARAPFIKKRPEAVHLGVGKVLRPIRQTDRLRSFAPRACAPRQYSGRPASRVPSRQMHLMIADAVPTEAQMHFLDITGTSGWSSGVSEQCTTSMSIASDQEGRPACGFDVSSGPPNRSSLAKLHGIAIRPAINGAGTPVVPGKLPVIRKIAARPGKQNIFRLRAHPRASQNHPPSSPEPQPAMNRISKRIVTTATTQQGLDILSGSIYRRAAPAANAVSRAAPSSSDRPSAIDEAKSSLSSDLGKGALK